LAISAQLADVVNFSYIATGRPIGRKRPNAAICDFHNDGPTPCEEANRRIFIASCFNVSYILPFG